MSLELKITTALKEAMKSKNKMALTALRAVKSAILLHKTQKSSDGELSNEDEMKILQKLVKQRKDSAAIYTGEGRNDLADPELKEAELIQQFLPKALSEAEVKEVVKSIIDEIGAEGMKDMGKVMGELKKLHSDEIDFAKAGSQIKELLNK